MDIENIEIGKKELGKLIGAAKRVWTGDKTTRISTDKIDRNESALFANDLRLARLAKQKQLLDDLIIDHIDEALLEHRGYLLADLQLKRDTALIELLKQTKSLINAVTSPDVDVADDLLMDLSERLGNMINELEKGAE